METKVWTATGGNVDVTVHDDDDDDDEQGWTEHLNILGTYFQYSLFVFIFVNSLSQHD